MPVSTDRARDNYAQQHDGHHNGNGYHAERAGVQIGARRPDLLTEAERKHRLEAAVREILTLVGEDPDREGLVDTPGTVAVGALS